MKVLLLLCACLCLLVADGAGQGFYSVHSPNGVDVWAVGKAGNVFHSYDGGVTWSSDGKGAADLRGVFAMNSNVWIVGDNAAGWKTTNAGDNWSTMTFASTVGLRAITFVNATTGWVAGDNGAIQKTTDAGATWVSQTSGTTERLNAIAFSDLVTGYAVGSGGVILKTMNGGTSWQSVGTPWQRELSSVAAKEQLVYVTGADESCYKSIDGGATWSTLDFTTDVKSDVDDVIIRNDGTAFFVGGGGYIRKSTDGGASFQWGTHSLHATLSDIYFFDNGKGWACSDKNNVILRTTDGGTTWSLPQGTTVTSQWTQKATPSGAIGNGYTLNPWVKERIYCAVGSKIYMSADIGETWVQTATISATTGSTHTFYVSPKDTNLYVAAYTGGGDHIRRSTDRGLTWTVTISRAFSAFGMPLALDYTHPDTLYFAPEDGHIYRSSDFAATWQDLGPKGFTSPCDFAVVRDSANILYLGDSGPSRISRSTDYGATWQLIYAGSASEIPTIATGSLRNSDAYATAWGSGGVQKTTSYGASWGQTATTGSAWGVDIASDDPNVVMFGVYGGGQSYLSANAGGSFVSSALSGSNYSILAYDRSTFLAEQSNGLYKLSFIYTVPTSNQQLVTLLSPNGGENWNYGSTRNITWAASNFTNVRIDYKTTPSAPWQTIASSVPSTSGFYEWRIPNTPTTQARVRISDASDSNPADSSDGVFNITVSSFSSLPTALAFGGVGVGRTHNEILQIINAGTAPLVISSASTSTANFIAGRTSFSIPAGGSDTLSVQFAPSAIQNYVDTLRLGTNAPSGVASIPLSGNGIEVAAVRVLAPNGGEVWNVGSTHDIRWSSNLLDFVTIHYRILPAAKWWLVASDVPAAAGTFAWSVPDVPSPQVLIRVRSSVDGTIVDESDNPFRIDISTAVSGSSEVPTSFELSQNYPNPFNPSTRISYGLPKEAFVKLSVYDALGQEVAQLVNEVQLSGRYTVEFSTHSSARDLSSGLYYYRLAAGDFIQTKKLVLLK